MRDNGEMGSRTPHKKKPKPQAKKPTPHHDPVLKQITSLAKHAIDKVAEAHGVQRRPDSEQILNYPQPSFLDDTVDPVLQHIMRMTEQTAPQGPVPPFDWQVEHQLSRTPEWIDAESATAPGETYRRQLRMINQMHEAQMRAKRREFDRQHGIPQLFE